MIQIVQCFVSYHHAFIIKHHRYYFHYLGVKLGLCMNGVSILKTRNAAV